MALVNFDARKLRWYHGQDGELVLVHEDDTYWAAVVICSDRTRLRWSGILDGRVSDDDRDEILRRWSGGHSYCWRDRITAAQYRVRRQILEAA